MIKQLRKRFILVMMLSLVIVFALLIAAINIVYSYNERKSIDARLEMIYNNGGSFPDGKQMRDGAQAEGEPRPKDSLDAGEPSNAAAPGEDEHSGTLAPPSPRIPALKQAFSLSPSTRTDPLQILTIIIPLPLRKTRFGSMLRRSSPATTNTEPSERSAIGFMEIRTEPILSLPSTATSRYAREGSCCLAPSASVPLPFCWCISWCFS